MPLFSKRSEEDRPCRHCDVRIDLDPLDRATITAALIFWRDAETRPDELISVMRVGEFAALDAQGIDKLAAAINQRRPWQPALLERNGFGRNTRSWSLHRGVEPRRRLCCARQPTVVVLDNNGG